MPPSLRRLLPQPTATTTVLEAYDVPRRSPGGDTVDRPWVGLCMISSLDGAIEFNGTSGPLGNENDRQVLATLRRLADVLVVGAGTVRDEGYGMPSRPGLRVGVVTNSGRLDLTMPLFSSGAAFVIAPESATIASDSVDVLRAGTDRVDLGDALRRLGSIVPGVRYVQAEGGAMLNAALLDGDLVDELDLTISPKLVGGASPRLTRGAQLVDASFTLAHLLADDEHYLFGRWLRER